ncbi:hypothetical protein [Streptomyces sp. NPDC059224]|uniref:hypothetical protein n=1 Tax=Streptomyces sp. NPDC059224 TaxID=3346775 RepID=UPI0036CFDDB1
MSVQDRNGGSRHVGVGRHVAQLPLGPSVQERSGELRRPAVRRRRTQCTDTSGHRLVAYYADPTTPDHDAMVLLDMLSTSQASRADDHSAVKDGPDRPGLS